MRFAGRRALVTGAASGIGRAVAELLAREGAALILVDRVPIDLAGDHHSATGDVRDEAFWDALAPELAGLDHAVVNAGIAGAGPIADHNLQLWRDILSVNLDGAFLTLRAAMRAMKGRGGSIVATASAAGIKAEPGVAAYGASKAALIHLAKVAAREGAADGIRVNAIAPAGVDTPVWDTVPGLAEQIAAQGRDAALAAFATDMPLGRFARAEEVAAQIAFLLSGDSATITGTTLVSDGGYTL